MDCSSSYYLQAIPLCEAYWLGMCVCVWLCCGNKGAEGEKKDSEGEGKKIERVRISGANEKLKR